MALNHGWSYHDRLDRTHAGLTVLDYYTQRYHHSTAAEWRDRIATEQILLNDRSTTAETMLQRGDRLTYHRPPWEEPDVPLAFDILYEDADLWAIAKPAGLPVLPGGGFLEHTLLRQLQHRFPQDTPVPIHRLGRGTSGLMLLARSPLAKSHLTQQLRDRTLSKRYRALASGLTPEQFTVNQAIGKRPYPQLGYLYGATADGLPAESHCQVVRYQADSTLLDVTIPTGRPHQIRIHLAVAGHPLVGDPLYSVGGVPIATTAVPGDCGYHLHAHAVTFRHPRTERSIQLICPPPLILQTEPGLP